MSFLADSQISNSSIHMPFLNIAKVYTELTIGRAQRYKKQQGHASSLMNIY